MQVLDGGGEMEALMRSIDWTNTPVGPVETWPQSLRTVLSILLPSEHPMFVWWGTDLIQFYNDGYRPILGATKHPGAMGQRGRECWTEIWDVIEPMVDKVFAGGSTYIKAGLLSLDRHGFLEECYFNYAYNPIRDESGAVAGVFVSCLETTDRIIAERRLVLGREWSIRAALDRNVPAVFHSVEEVLRHAATDLPFALLYEVSGSIATLVSCVGLERGVPAAPSELKLEDHSPWPVGTVARSGREVLVEDLEPRLGALICGAWPEPVTRALVLPLVMGADETTTVVLVAGLSPRLRFGDEYRDFLQLLARQIASSISSVRAFARENQRVAELAELDRAKTTFFSNVSHEFRTPLTLILGPVEDALTSPDPSLAGDKLDLVGRSAKRLLKLVNTLLDFSRIEAGRAETRPQPTDLSEFTIDLASAFRSLVERAGLTLTVDCPPLAEPVYVDREMYEKIVLNLLSNAFKFTFEGEIRVSLDAAEGHARLTVEDTGTGISGPELLHVFERFHRVKDAKGRSYEGSGIGLALVQELAKLQGGSVSVESRLGEGTRFTVLLPLGNLHLPPERVEAASPSTPVNVTPFLDEASHWLPTQPAVSPTMVDGELPTLVQDVPAHILLADDNADMREYVRKLLVAGGWKVEAVGDGEAALLRARACPPDLVLADVMMPGLDGFGLLEALKDDEATRAVPVILLSARADEASVIDGMQKGADDYLVKPFSAKELVSRVAARLKIAREGAEALAGERAVRAAAVAERQKLHGLFMQTPVAICILEGPRHSFTFANPCFRDLVGGREVVGKPLLEALPELAGEGFDVLMDQVVKTGAPFVGNEVSAKLGASGTSQLEEGFFNFVYSPLRNERGEVEGVMVCASDVTEQVQARRRIELLVIELKLGDQRKDEFLAMLGHELRNPLATVSLSLSLLETVEGDVVKTAKHRGAAQRQMRTLVRLVDDLLDVARIMRGSVSLRKEPVDLASIVQHAVASARPTIEDRGHELSVTMAPGAFRINADATRLEQVLVNLLLNAAKYTEPGGVLSVRIAREGVAGADHVIVRVRDTGRGIPADMLDRVFDLFVQVSPAVDRSSGGLGLGLTLVKRLVEMHGGSVSAHSEGSGKGSEFVVRLPLEQASSSTAAPVVAAPDFSAAAQKRRVLIVEDSEDLREALKQCLELLGHEVVVATDGLEGVERLLAMKPDVALVDVGLPGIDGYELARRVRATPGGHVFRLVAVTGYGGPEAKSMAEQAGFDLHLTKPIDINRLSELVNSFPPNEPPATGIRCADQ